MFYIENWLFFSLPIAETIQWIYHLQFKIFLYLICPFIIILIIDCSPNRLLLQASIGFPPLHKLFTSTWLGSNCLMWAFSVFLPATGVPGIFSPSPSFMERGGILPTYTSAQDPHFEKFIPSFMNISPDTSVPLCASAVLSLLGYFSLSTKRFKSFQFHFSWHPVFAGF